MTVSSTIAHGSTIDRVFGVLAEASTYKRLLLLFVGFPLGIFYFVSIVVLTAAGVGLIPIVAGIGILTIALWVATMFARAERHLMASLAGASFRAEAPAKPGIRDRLLDANAWKRVAYFVLRIPVSIIGFAAAIVMTTSLSLLFAPLVYTLAPIWVGVDRVTDWQEALLVSCGGAVFGLLSAHAVSAVADVQRRLAEWLL